MRAVTHVLIYVELHVESKSIIYSSINGPIYKSVEVMFDLKHFTQATSSGRRITLASVFSKSESGSGILKWPAKIQWRIARGKHLRRMTFSRHKKTISKQQNETLSRMLIECKGSIIMSLPWFLG